MAEVAVNDKTIEQLKHLLSITTDSMEGYKQSANNSPGPEFTALFTDYLIQRGEYAEELRAAIHLLGGDAKTVSGGTFSALGRLWTTIKTTIGSDAERTALEACMADEKATIAEYEKVLANAELSPELRETLTDQKTGVERALTRSEQLARVYN
ncbi:PA2169 family four-helix-bundle protein [Mucilaginibacter sp. AW1-3]